MIRSKPYQWLNLILYIIIINTTMTYLFSSTSIFKQKLLVAP